MNSEHVAVVSSLSAVGGALVNQGNYIPYVSGQGIIPAVFGLAVAGIGYFVVKQDYVAEIMVGAGIGYGLSAVL